MSMDELVRFGYDETVKSKQGLVLVGARAEGPGVRVPRAACAPWAWCVGTFSISKAF